MRRLTIFVVAVALVYAGYWFAGAKALQNALDTQIDDMRDAGWDVSYDDLRVRGFPSRFDTNATGLAVAAPAGNLGYAAPFLQAFALSYQPNRAIIAFPAEQQLRIAGQNVDVKSNGLRASAGVKANTALELDTITIEASDIALIATTWGILSFTDFLAALRASGPLPHSYDVYLSAQNITLPATVTARLNAAGNLPATLETVTGDAQVTFDKSLNRHTLPDWETDPGLLRGLALRDMTLHWGKFTVSGDGSLTVDKTGIPEGTITLRATEWQQLLDIAVSAGLMPSDLRFMASSMGQTLSGGSTDLSLPITFQNGNMSIGPIPLGPAPSLH